MIKRTTPTFERVKELFSYDPDSGSLTRNISRGNKKAGSRAGSVSHGYLLVFIDGFTSGVHRIAWLLMTGDWPPFEIDHIDMNGLNNRWNNLREATHSQNMMNKLYPNSTGFKGVSIRRKCTIRPFVARIHINNRHKHLGYFKTAKEAHTAYVRAAQKEHGEFARPS